MDEPLLSPAMSDLFEYCKRNGEWSPQQQYCTIQRPPLAALLAASPFKLISSFWIFFVGANLLFRLVCIYVVR